MDNWPLDNLELIVINVILEAQHKIPYLQFSGSLVRKLFIVALTHLTLTSVVRSHGPFCSLGDIWTSLGTFVAVTTREGCQRSLVGGGPDAAQHFRMHSPPFPPSAKNYLLKMSAVLRPRNPAGFVAKGSGHDGE